MEVGFLEIDLERAQFQNSALGELGQGNQLFKV